MTRLVMTLLVRDESDIVRQNIDFHLAQGVDFIVATDNGSTDGTRDILADYERRGVLHLIDEPGRDYRQGEWVSRMALIARERFGADWIDLGSGAHWRRWYRMFEKGEHDRVIREVLPTQKKLLRDLRDGTVVVDRRLEQALADLSGFSELSTPPVTSESQEQTGW